MYNIDISKILCLLYNTCQILIFFKFTLILDLYINYDSPQRSINFNHELNK